MLGGVVYYGGEPIVAHSILPRKNKRYMACYHRDGSSWEEIRLDQTSRPEENHLVLDPAGVPTLCYTAGGDLTLARWNGSSWEKEVVEALPGSLAQRISVAFDPDDGTPSVAYQLEISGSATRIVRFVDWTGSEWLGEDVAQATYMPFGNHGYDPISGDPALTYRENVGTDDYILYFVPSDGLDPDGTVHWLTPEVIAQGEITVGSLAYTSDGLASTPHVKYRANYRQCDIYEARVASQDSGGQWPYELILMGCGGSMVGHIHVDPTGGLAAAFSGNELIYGTKN
jgi:hypothetical protein